MISLRTTSTDETRELAAAVVPLLRPGDLVLLAGDMGAGKTAFTQGLGKALGVKDQITSPTFTIAREYDAGALTLHHLDVYRLERLDEIADVGLSEILDDGSIVVIEWGDVILPVLPADFLELRFTFGDGDDERRLNVRPVGARWAARLKALSRALDPWTESN